MERVSIPWATALMLYKTGEVLQWWSEDTSTWWCVFSHEFFTANKNHHYRIMPDELRRAIGR